MFGRRFVVNRETGWACRLDECDVVELSDSLAEQLWHDDYFDDATLAGLAGVPLVGLLGSASDNAPEFSCDVCGDDVADGHGHYVNGARCCRECVATELTRVQLAAAPNVPCAACELVGVTTLVDPTTATVAAWDVMGNSSGAVFVCDGCADGIAPERVGGES